MRKKHRNLILENVVITDIANEGKGIGRINDFVVFAENAIIGDVVDVKVEKKKKDYAIGVVHKIHTKSNKRVEPKCTHFGLCGGCKWQNVQYETQIAYKQKNVYDAFRRIGKIELDNILPIIGCTQIFEYRNKLEYTFSDRKWLTEAQIETNEQFERRGLGFHIPKSFSTVVQIDKCFLLDDKHNEIRNKLYDFAIENNFTFYNLKFHGGLLRNLIIRNSTINEWMITVCFGENDIDNIIKIMEFLKNNFPFITSLNYIINTKLNDTIYDQEIINYNGKEFITEKLADIKYKISPKSFFQTNPKQAKILYDVVVDFAQCKTNDTIYDLYCGTGSIGLYVAKNCKKIVGIEQINDAIEDAKINAKINNIENCTFLTGTVETILEENFTTVNGFPDVIILDPPRAGLHDNVVKNLLQIACKKIVYVSCNPVTQARDVQLLLEKYTIVKCQPVDMFPHTYHIENVVLLELNEK